MYADDKAADVTDACVLDDIVGGAGVGDCRVDDEVLGEGGRVKAGDEEPLPE